MPEPLTVSSRAIKGPLYHITVQGMQQNSHCPHGVGQSIQPVFGPFVGLAIDEAEELDEEGSVWLAGALMVEGDIVKCYRIA